MVSERVSTKDIVDIGAFGRLTVQLPTPKAVLSTKNLITRIKYLYPREDGLTYTTSVDKSTNTITISVVKPEDVNRRGRKSL